MGKGLNLLAKTCACYIVFYKVQCPRWVWCSSQLETDWACLNSEMLQIEDHLPRNHHDDDSTSEYIHV